AMCASLGRSEGFARLTALAPHFSPGYRDTFPAHDGARDLGVLEDLTTAKDGLRLRAHVWRKENEAAPALRLKLYVLGGVLPLSASLPIFENLGLKVIAEDSYPVTIHTSDDWAGDGAVLDFLMERADQGPGDLSIVKQPLEEAFHAIVSGEAESDGFN